jgi:hypothetical protein
MAMATQSLPRLEDELWMTFFDGVPDEAGDAIPASVPWDPTASVE